MLAVNSISVAINEYDLNLKLDSSKDLSIGAYEDFLCFLKVYANGKTFKKIEIDFENTFVEIYGLLDVLIKNSYMYTRNNQTEVVLNLGSYDLEGRIKHLRSFNRHKIKKCKINYHKKTV